MKHKLYAILSIMLFLTIAPFTFCLSKSMSLNLTPKKPYVHHANVANKLSKKDIKQWKEDIAKVDKNYNDLEKSIIDSGVSDISPSPTPGPTPAPTPPEPIPPPRPTPDRPIPQQPAKTTTGRAKSTSTSAQSSGTSARETQQLASPTTGAVGKTKLYPCKTPCSTLKTRPNNYKYLQNIGTVDLIRLCICPQQTKKTISGLINY